MSRAMALIEATRPRQWVKNLLVLAAPIAGGRLLDPGVARGAAVSLLAFTLASASTYLLNDVFDRELDAKHPAKRERPIARGAVKVRTAFWTGVILAVASLVCSAAMSRPELVVIVGSYLALGLTYSRWLKHQPLLDIVVIAAGFLLRAAAGGIATETPLSTLFMITATAGALFVAAGKRSSELGRVRSEGPLARPSLAFYTPTYLRTLSTVSLTTTIVGVALWAIEVAGDSPRPTASRLAIAPFALLLLRYAWWIDRGEAEAPEDVFRRDPLLSTLALLGIALMQFGLAGG